MQLWELPERENSWTCSDFVFQTYPFGLQRWEGKKQLSCLTHLSEAAFPAKENGGVQQLLRL